MPVVLDARSAEVKDAGDPLGILQAISQRQKGSRRVSAHDPPFEAERLLNRVQIGERGRQIVRPVRVGSPATARLEPDHARQIGNHGGDRFKVIATARPAVAEHDRRAGPFVADPQPGIPNVQQCVRHGLSSNRALLTA